MTVNGSLFFPGRKRALGDEDGRTEAERNVDGERRMNSSGVQ